MEETEDMEVSMLEMMATNAPLDESIPLGYRMEATFPRSVLQQLCSHSKIIAGSNDHTQRQWTTKRLQREKELHKIE
uniref:Protein RD3-like n=1 Tax=Loa loa TaxID=7209 RepID=A0A1I7W222_LOALO